MSRYIDADKIEYRETKRIYDGYDSEGSEYYRHEPIAYKSDIDEIPTADVVAVVRCRDCKHNADNGGDCNRTITHTSRNLVCEVNEYKYIGLEYCSYGERREENEG
jgi:hypothetical protein